MTFGNFIPLLLVISTFAVSLIFGLKSKTRFLYEIKYFGPALVFSWAIIIMLIIKFAGLQIITFNPEYLSGKYILQLPIEEWLFWPAVSFLAFSVYLFVKEKFSSNEKANFFLIIGLILLVIFALITWFSRAKVYPFFVFMLLSVYLGYTIFRNRFKYQLPPFMIALLISAIPFFILKAIFYNLPVENINPDYTFGVQIINVPVEDFGYFFLLLLMNITIYEYLRTRLFY